MKKDFDFDDIGKKTPYRVPEGFFDEMQREVQKRTYADKPANRRLWIAASTSIVVAAVLIGFLSGKMIPEGLACRGRILKIIRRQYLPINGFVKCRTRSWKSSSASPKTICF